MKPINQSLEELENENNLLEFYVVELETVNEEIAKDNVKLECKVAELADLQKKKPTTILDFTIVEFEQKKNY